MHTTKEETGLHSVYRETGCSVGRSEVEGDWGLWDYEICPRERERETNVTNLS